MAPKKLIFEPKKTRLKHLPVSWGMAELFTDAIEEIENIGRPEERMLYNHNNRIFSNPIDMSTQGYIYPSLPTPYAHVPDADGSGLHHIEIVVPELSTRYNPEATKSVSDIK